MKCQEYNHLILYDMRLVKAIWAVRIARNYEMRNTYELLVVLRYRV